MKSLIANNWEKPNDAVISEIASVLDLFFSMTCCRKISRLAILAAYQCLLKETKRFQGKELRFLDGDFLSRTGLYSNWDLEAISSDGKLYEAVMIYHGVPITFDLIKIAENKLQTTSVDRFYLLSTVETPPEDLIGIAREAERIGSTHQCEVIIDHVLPTLKYYLRLLVDPHDFIECYINLLGNDKSIKPEHRQRWNQLIEGIGKL